jgi:hypothetical protein
MATAFDSVAPGGVAQAGFDNVFAVLSVGDDGAGNVTSRNGGVAVTRPTNLDRMKVMWPTVQ